MPRSGSNATQTKLILLSGVPARLVDPVLEQLRLSALETESPGQLILADLIGSHACDRQIRSGRARYRRRRDLLVDVLVREFSYW